MTIWAMTIWAITIWDITMYAIGIASWSARIRRATNLLLREPHRLQAMLVDMRRLCVAIRLHHAGHNYIGHNDIGYV